MSQAQLIRNLSARTGLPPAAVRKSLKQVANSARELLATGGKVDLPGIGVISVQQVAERTSRNPISGAKVKVPAKKSIAFRAAKALREAA